MEVVEQSLCLVPRKRRELEGPRREQTATSEGWACSRFGLVLSSELPLASWSCRSDACGHSYHASGRHQPPYLRIPSHVLRLVD